MKYYIKLQDYEKNEGPFKKDKKIHPPHHPLCIPHSSVEISLRLPYAKPLRELTPPWCLRTLTPLPYALLTPSLRPPLVFLTPCIFVVFGVCLRLPYAKHLRKLTLLWG